MSAPTNQDPLRVVMAPIYPSNPYQIQLREVLRERGVKVIRATPPDGNRPLDEAVRGRPPHVLHLHWLHQFCLAEELEASKEMASDFLRTVRRARKKGVRVVWTVHNLVNHERRHARVEWMVQRKLARMADAVIVHTRSSGVRLRRHLLLPRLPQLRVIPQANYMGAYQDEITRAEARAELGIEEDTLTLLFFGRILGYKGLEELFDAFRRARLPEGTRLLVVGKVDDEAVESRLRTQAEAVHGVVFLPGFVEDERIQVFMNAADAVVLPYRKILTSAAGLLAMGFGLPVIAPRRGEFPEIVGDEGGILYSPFAWHGLRRGIERAARQRDRLAAMGARNLERAREWSAERVAETHLALYEELAGRSAESELRSRT